MLIIVMFTVQKMKFSIKDFYSKCDQIPSFLRIWSYLLKKPFVGKFIFRAVVLVLYDCFPVLAKMPEDVT